MKHQRRLQLLLEKLRYGDCNREEIDELKKLMTRDDHHHLEQYLDNDLRIQSNEEVEGKREKIWQLISNKIEAEVPALEKNNIRKMMIRWTAVASIALLFFASYQFFNTAKEVTAGLIVAERANTSSPKVIELPDGSKVWLNSNSRVTYQNNFSVNTREVKLEGQAFFEVAHNEAKPFSVITKNLKTTVLGTSFDINTYAKNEVIEISLFSGKVEAIDQDSNKKWTLHPSHQLTFSPNGTGKVRSFDPDLKAVWRTGEITFSETKMERVINVLQKQYKNCNIELSSSQLAEAEVSGTFKTSETVEDILELVCFSKGWTLQNLDRNNFLIKE